MKNSAETLSGWGRYPKVPTTTSRNTAVLTGNLPRITRGNGRSYGDQAICENGITWLNDRHNRIISFDETSGTLRAESGILLSEILSTFIPRGWTLPVCPGTQYVSLGGALANDVHGKNHHVHGSFANHVRSFDILIPSGEHIHCTRKQHPEIFWASIGGAGLLGHIESIEIVLKKIETPFFNTFSFKASDLNEMMELLDVQSIEHPYSVGWIDTSNKAMNGVLSCGTPLEKTGGDDFKDQFGPPALTMPDVVPNNMLNTFSIKLVNAYIGHRLATTKGHTPMKDFFFPLDGIGLWNRAYGNNGFMQFQCVVPIEQGKRNMTLLMDIVKKSGCLPFMNVIKRMGAGNNGFFSFPTEGYTLALDFATSKNSIALIKYLNQWVATVDGRVYLGKDALLNSHQMRQMYPKVEEFLKVKRAIDPQNIIKSAQSLRLRLF